MLSTKCIAPGEGVTGFALANRSAINQLHPSLDFVGSIQNALASTNPWLPCRFSKTKSCSARSQSIRPARSLHRRPDADAGDCDEARIRRDWQRSSPRRGGSNALTDVLTGLPNGRYLTMRFDEEVSCAAHGRSFQVMMLDLDDFKLVNDTFGHKVGDKMLREIARSFRHNFENMISWRGMLEMNS